MKPETDILQIQLDLSQVRSKSIMKIKQVSDSTAILFHSLLTNELNEFVPLQTDTLPFVFFGENDVANLGVLKKSALDWLIKKAFEDMLAATIESLVEAYKFFKIKTLSEDSRKTPKSSLEESEKALQAIRDKAHKMFLPNLINEMEQELAIAVPLKEEILSINNVRNCLVHRNGLVTSLETEKEQDNNLRLHFIDLVTLIQKDGTLIPLRWEDKATLKTDSMALAIAEKMVEYPLGTHVWIDQNIFNAVSYTCTAFVERFYGCFIEYVEAIKKGT